MSRLHPSAVSFQQVAERSSSRERASTHVREFLERRTDGALVPSPSGASTVVSQPSRTAGAPTASRVLDFDLHGLVGIRLVDASASDRAVVTGQLGPIAAPLEREPDIVVRFVDRLSAATPEHFVGVSDSSFDEDDFFILRSKHRAPVRVRIPFDAIGGRCEIVCEHGVTAVPLLIAIINLTVLAKGGLALHASAFRYHDTGVLVTGWSKGGKTELLLGFIEQGAEYIGDEWIYLTGDGERMFGIPEPIRIWDWHLSQLPRYRSELPVSRRLALGALGQSRRIASAIADRVTPFGLRTGRQLARVADLLDRQRYAFLSPATAFGRRLGPLSGTPDRVVFIASTERRETYLERVSSDWIADRMAVSLEEERALLESYYRRFRFAFPDRSNPLIDGAAMLERERLRKILRDKPCYALFHPYPPSIKELYQVAAPIISLDQPADRPQGDSKTA